MVVKVWSHGGLREGSFHLPDENPTAPLVEYGFQSVPLMTFDYDYIHVDVFVREKNINSNLGKFLVFTTCGPQRAVVSCETMFEMMGHLKQPLEFIKLLVEVQKKS